MGTTAVSDAGKERDCVAWASEGQVERVREDGRTERTLRALVLESGRGGGGDVEGFGAGTGPATAAAGPSGSREEARDQGEGET